MIIVGKKIDKLKKLSGWNICITAKSETNITQIKKENIKKSYLIPLNTFLIHF